MNDFMRLLEKKWTDLRHVETERHWILTAYAVIVAGTLSLIVKTGNSDASNAISYLILAILGMIAGLHSFRAAWQLREVQNSIDKIVKEWKEGLNPETTTFKEFWSFSTQTLYTPSCERWQRRRWQRRWWQRPWAFLKWFGSQYRFWKPTFSVVYAYIYSSAIGYFLAVSLWHWTR